jgi:hypothetical protein
METLDLQPLYRRYQRDERLAKSYNCVLDERTGDPLVHLVIDPVGQTLTPVLRLGAGAPPGPPRRQDPEDHPA